MSDENKKDDACEICDNYKKKIIEMSNEIDEYEKSKRKKLLTKEEILSQKGVRLKE